MRFLSGFFQSLIFLFCSCVFHITCVEAKGVPELSGQEGVTKGGDDVAIENKMNIYKKRYKDECSELFKFLTKNKADGVGFLNETKGRLSCVHVMKRNKPAHDSSGRHHYSTESLENTYDFVFNWQENYDLGAMRSISGDLQTLHGGEDRTFRVKLGCAMREKEDRVILDFKAYIKDQDQWLCGNDPVERYMATRPDDRIKYDEWYIAFLGGLTIKSEENDFSFGRGALNADKPDSSFRLYSTSSYEKLDRDRSFINPDIVVHTIFSTIRLNFSYQ